MPKLGDVKKKPAAEEARPRKKTTAGDKSKGVVAAEFTGESQAPARIRISKGVTKNMGDYNSARVEVTIEMDVNPSKEVLAAVSHTIEVVNEIVDRELHDQVEALEL